jgi:hypothetical protein
MLNRASFVSPFQGMIRFSDCSQGVALGCFVTAFQAEDRNAPKGPNMRAQGNALGTESFTVVLP